MCTGEASHLLVLLSDEREQIALMGLCRWCVATQRPYVMAALQEAGWNESLGLVDLNDDVAVRQLERMVAGELERGDVVLGALPSAS